LPYTNELQLSKKLHFAFFSLLSLLVATDGLPRSPYSKKPNIIFSLAGDLSFIDLGC
jgi:hypothetical protein